VAQVVAVVILLVLAEMAVLQFGAVTVLPVKLHRLHLQMEIHQGVVLVEQKREIRVQVEVAVYGLLIGNG
jgi:hypothetical protein